MPSAVCKAWTSRNASGWAACALVFRHCDGACWSLGRTFYSLKLALRSRCLAHFSTFSEAHLAALVRREPFPLRLPCVTKRRSPEFLPQLRYHRDEKSSQISLRHPHATNTARKWRVFSTQLAYPLATRGANMRSWLYERVPDTVWYGATGCVLTRTIAWLSSNGAYPITLWVPLSRREAQPRTRY